MQSVKEKVDQLNAEIMATREWISEVISKQWYERIIKKLKK